MVQGAGELLNKNHIIPCTLYPVPELLVPNDMVYLS